MTGVSFIVPVRNGAAHLREALASIAAQRDGRPMEIIVVEDQSQDSSADLLAALAPEYGLTVLPGPGRGAAAAVNAGIRIATMPIVCQVDQDVVLEPGWMARLATATDDPRVGAAQGYYATDPGSGFFARVMGLDLEQRYAAVTDRTDHVCTGNSAYRAEALAAVGLLDETLGYGYDNDLSYRLRAAGYHLVLCRSARSRHRWREGLIAYLVQQYGFGYGRLDVVARHPSRCAGDAVSPAGMMAHPVIMGVALLCGAGALTLAALGRPARVLAAAGAVMIAGLMVERTVAGIRAWRRFGDAAALAFPFVHLARDLAWVAASLVWLVRRLLGRECQPAHSMRARPAAR
jgi:hypothetical protein